MQLWRSKEELLAKALVDVHYYHKYGIQIQCMLLYQNAVMHRMIICGEKSKRANGMRKIYRPKNKWKKFEGREKLEGEGKVRNIIEKIEGRAVRILLTCFQLFMQVCCLTFKQTSVFFLDLSCQLFHYKSKLLTA